jgi:Immunity protein 8
MVKPVLKSLFSFDAVDGLDKYQPADPESFGIRVQAFVGSAADSASDSFDFVACTPHWLADRYAEADPRRWDAGLLFANTAFSQLLGAPEPAGSTISPDPDEPMLGYGFVFMRRWDYVRLLV